MSTVSYQSCIYYSPSRDAGLRLLSCRNGSAGEGHGKQPRGCAPRQKPLAEVGKCIGDKPRRASGRLHCLRHLLSYFYYSTHLPTCSASLGVLRQLLHASHHDHGREPQHNVHLNVDLLLQ